jgi:hypothetical protein
MAAVIQQSWFTSVNLEKYCASELRTGDDCFLSDPSELINHNEHYQLM